MNYQIKYEGPPTSSIPFDNVFGLYSVSLKHININVEVYLNGQKLDKSLLLLINKKSLDITFLPENKNYFIIRIRKPPVFTNGISTDYCFT